MTATLDGRFMGSGPTKVTAHFRPEVDGPDFDLRVAIDATDLRTMNDMLRAHGKFDVVAGVFSFYSELAVKNAPDPRLGEAALQGREGLRPGAGPRQERDEEALREGRHRRRQGDEERSPEGGRHADGHLWTARQPADQHAPGDRRSSSRTRSSRRSSRGSTGRSANQGGANSSVRCQEEQEPWHLAPS